MVAFSLDRLNSSMSVSLSPDIVLQMMVVGEREGYFTPGRVVCAQSMRTEWRANSGGNGKECEGLV